MEKLRKLWLPWAAAAQFSSEEEYAAWLSRRLKVFGDIRMLLLVLAAGLLIVGYVLDQRPVMLLTVLPLVLVLLLSLAVGKTETALNQMNKP